MTAIEIKAKEQELMREINNDAGLLDSALRYVRKIKKTKSQAPCQYSIEELKGRLQNGRKAAKAGACKTQEEMRSKHSV